MKKIVFIVFAMVLSIPMIAQLTNSEWKGTIKGDNPRNVIMNFRKDSVTVYTISDDQLVESMTYTVKNSVLTLRKLEGMSDCDNDVLGKYKIEIKAGLLYLKTQDDPCYDRSSALDVTKWFPWKKHPEVPVNASILKKYVGEYEFDAGHHILITLENGRLQMEGPNNNLPKSTLIALSSTRFFLKLAGVEIDFIKNAKGETIKMISHEEEDHELKKIK
jgi:hypothetical protein